MPHKEVKSPTEPAGFIGAHSRELSKLAAGNGLTLLAFLLDMARIEAEEVASSASKAQPKNH